MIENYSVPQTIVNDQVLVIDYDHYLSQTSEKRLLETLAAKRVMIEQDITCTVENMRNIFLLVENTSTEVLKWVESILHRAKDARVLVVTVGRPNVSFIPYLSQKLSGILSLHSLYKHGANVLKAIDEFGVFLEQGLHSELVKHLHEQKLRDRPIKRLILREEEVQYRLTKNERTVLQHILDGHNNRKIAELMYLAPSTVSTVISHLLKKLEANDRTDAMVRIIRNGWVDAVR
ncbi:helix-turn-helix transcriptional regulator [Alkalicoccus daliensis]|uniref:Two-component system, NarL family, response regulator DegU n=1 Tax=Alkalicoccus daliensis TaxID=745820 RepID=A0A1H0J0J9_9BACI|nr:LuxR C-terminal-related transcriptional regulator [Alkalicoccus daliensis]SDO37264.1 two-component system, NarL family, response regulator DegU [Alkalicoccus daliensis]